MRGHPDIAKVAEKDPKKIEPGDVVIGSMISGRQLIGRYKERHPTEGFVVTDRNGRDVYVTSIRRAKVAQQNVQAPPRKWPPAIEKEIEKLKQSPHINKSQVKRILEITQGNIAGLKVGYRHGTRNIWIVSRGRRHDIDRAGNISRQENLGRPNPPVANALAKNLKCPLCGEENQVPKHEVHIKCQKCGFPLRRVRIRMQ